MGQNPTADQILAHALRDLNNVDAAIVIDALSDGAHEETPIFDAIVTPDGKTTSLLSPLAAASMIRSKNDPHAARVYRERIIANLLDRGANVARARTILQISAVDAFDAKNPRFLVCAVDGLSELLRIVHERQQTKSIVPVAAPQH